jgi:hypothetical protein
LWFHRLAGALEAAPIVAVREGATSGPVLISAHVANIDANRHITAIKPVYFEPRLPLAGDFS